MDDSPASDECVMCSRPATMMCKRCRCQIYCSRQCQTKDWRIHKLLCSSRQQFETPPHKDARRAIVFEENEPTVKFIWVTIQLKRDDDPDDPGEWESPILEEYFGPGQAGHCQPYYNNVIRSRRLKEHIDLRFREDFLHDGSRPNKAVAATVGAMTPVWCGPLIALRQKNTYLDSKRIFLNPSPGYGHMDMGCLREVVDYLTTYGGILDEKASPEATKKAPSLRGVRINCLGDTKAGRGLFEAVEVAVDRMKDRLTVPSLPARLGMPLELKKITPPKEWQFDSHILQNPTVTFLHLDDNSNSSRWGWAPFEWDEMVGSVVLVRPDGKDLLPQHVEALCHYCRYFLQPVFEDSMGSGMDPESFISKEEVLYQMSPKSFELFCIGFFNYRRATDPKWDYVRVPDIVGSPAKVKGLHDNFHKLKKFL
jgi:hypothetical protein